MASVGFSSFVLFQSVLSIAFGIAVFAVCAVLILLVDHMGLLATVNGLLGSTMANFTVRRLVELSAVFACALAVVRILFEMVRILILNSSLMMTGGVPLNLRMDDGLKAMLAGSGSIAGNEGSTDAEATQVIIPGSEGEGVGEGVAVTQLVPDGKAVAGGADSKAWHAVVSHRAANGAKAAQCRMILSRLHENAMKGGALQS